MRRTLHKACFLSAIMLLLLLAIPITALADGGEDKLTQTVDGYRVTLIFENLIASGENQIHIQVSDAQGQPVSNAQVEVSVVKGEAAHTEAKEPTPQSDMHGMGSMPEKEATPTPSVEHNEMGMVAFTAGHEAGRYEGEIVVAGSGEWAIRVHLTVEGQLVEIDFPFHVAASSQAGKHILLGFFAINAVILGMAVTLKFRPIAAKHFRG